MKVATFPVAAVPSTPLNVKPPTATMAALDTVAVSVTTWAVLLSWPMVTVMVNVPSSV